MWGRGKSAFTGRKISQNAPSPLPCKNVTDGSSVRPTNSHLPALFNQQETYQYVLMKVQSTDWGQKYQRQKEQWFFSLLWMHLKTKDRRGSRKFASRNAPPQVFYISTIIIRKQVITPKVCSYFSKCSYFIVKILMSSCSDPFMHHTLTVYRSLYCSFCKLYGTTKEQRCLKCMEFYQWRKEKKRLVHISSCTA